MKANHNFGCPNTEQRSKKVDFERDNPNLDLHIKPDAPHYSARDTRIAYDEWAKQTNK